MGVVCRDSSGKILWCATEFAFEIRDCSLAEAMAVR